MHRRIRHGDARYGLAARTKPRTADCLSLGMLMSAHSLAGIRVMHVVPGYAPAQGGIETLVDGLGPVLKARGITCSVLAPRRWFDRPDGFVSHGMAVESVDIPNDHSGEPTVTPMLRMFAGVRRAIQRQRPDVIHIHGIGHLLVAATRVAQSSAIPAVHHIHGNVHAEILQTASRAICESRTVIAVSDTTALSIRDVAGRTDPVEIIGNGIPQPRITNGGTRSGLAMVGRLEPNKGFEHGIHAVARLKSRFPLLRLRVIGVGEGLIALQELAWSLGVANRVDFLGRCSRERTQQVIADSDAVIIPSLSIEGFSLVAAEAAFLSTPSVAYRTGGLATTVVDGISGVTAPTGDLDGLISGIARILDDHQLARQLGRGAYAFAKSTFDVNVFADRLADVYAAALDNHGKARA